MKLRALAPFALLLALPAGCAAESAPSEELVAGGEDELRAARLPASLATAWTQLACDQVAAEKLSPPIASRIYAHVGVALYESTLPASTARRSLGGQLRGLGTTPEPGGPIDVRVAMAEAAGRVMGGLLSEASAAPIGALAESQREARRSKVSRAVFERSIAYGATVARNVLARASRDGFAERVHHPYIPSSEPHAWVPTLGGSASPLEPAWGTLEPFALERADECAPAPHAPFSTSPKSDFYDEARAVYETRKALGAREELIAKFWADLPGESATPAGHWLSMTGHLLEERNADLDRAAEVIAVATIGMADAFISCWHAKYETNLMRPETYIREHIDADFTPLLRTPSFPEYTSGHSVASAAAAELLTAHLGGGPVTDHSNPKFEARSFKSLRAAADEAAVSRLYGGIHYPMGITSGLDQGRCVAERVAARVRTKR